MGRIHKAKDAIYRVERNDGCGYGHGNHRPGRAERLKSGAALYVKGRPGRGDRHLPDLRAGQADAGHPGGPAGQGYCAAGHAVFGLTLWGADHAQRYSPGVFAVRCGYGSHSVPAGDPQGPGAGGP